MEVLPNYVSIVIPVFNKWNFTKSCLKDLAQLSDGHQILIIDNASSDETQAEFPKLQTELAAMYPGRCHISYIRNEENTFHSKACNQGFNASVGEYVIFLNNDIRVKANHGDWTKVLVEACQSTQGIVGPTMGQLDGNLNFVREANEQLKGNSYLGGWCIAACRHVWNAMKIEGTRQVWNEEFPFYFNDTDLSFRARRKSVPLTVVAMPDVVHFGKVSAAQINIPKLYNEGRAVFMRKWGSKK
jgi:O-antigen biosynthesis protein